MTTTIWTQSGTIAEALGLPEGRYAADVWVEQGANPEHTYAADVGLWVEQDVDPEHTMIAANAIKNSGEEVMVATQAGLIVKAQELGVAFTDWCPLRTILRIDRFCDGG